MPEGVWTEFRKRGPVFSAAKRGFWATSMCDEIVLDASLQLNVTVVPRSCLECLNPAPRSVDGGTAAGAVVRHKETLQVRELVLYNE